MLYEVITGKIFDRSEQVVFNRSFNGKTFPTIPKLYKKILDNFFRHFIISQYSGGKKAQGARITSYNVCYTKLLRNTDCIFFSGGNLSGH